MIKKWVDLAGPHTHEIGPLSKEETEEIEKDWEKSKESIDKREAKYGNSLRNIPLDSGLQNNQYSTLFCSRYEKRSFAGNRPSLYLVHDDGRENTIVQISADGADRNFRDRDKDLMFLCPIAIKGSLEDLTTSSLENVDSIYVTTRKKVWTGDKDKTTKVWERALQRDRNLSVATRVTDREIIIQARHYFYLTIRAKECIQCGRPYWNFSNFDSKKRRLWLPHTVENVDEFGGYFELDNYFGERLCGFDCQNKWHDAWGVRLKSIDQVRDEAQRMVGERDYDWGQIIPHYSKLGPFAWFITVSNGEGVRDQKDKRQIILSLDGKILRDQELVDSKKSDSKQ